MPWKPAPPRQQALSIKVGYDRTRLRVDDTLNAWVEVTYNLARPTFMVIVDLGIPPGFAVRREDLAAMVQRKQITRYSLTGRQITLYLGKVQPRKPMLFRYRLKAMFPVRAQTPRSVA